MPLPVHRLLGWWILLALGVSGCGRIDEGPRPPRHLLLITVDTLRADHLGIHGYPRPTSPSLDRWAADGVVFERAISQWPKTGPSFASLFTGRYPSSTGLTHRAAVELPDDPGLLPRLLRESGFTTVAVVSNAVLAADLGWSQGFDEYRQTWELGGELSDDPLEYRRWIHAGQVNALALPLLERHRDAERLFAWVHYSDPHAPYVLPAGVENPFLGDLWASGEEIIEGRVAPAVRLGDSLDRRHYVSQYDANIRLIDEAIGELLGEADSLGLLEESLVVFASDHGESLGEHDYYFEHGRLPYNASLHVPLVISLPGEDEPAARVEEPVELVDLFPTLLDLLLPGTERPALEGDSLVRHLAGRGSAPSAAADLAFSEAGGGRTRWIHYRAVQDRRWKLVYHPPCQRHGCPAAGSELELYDLAADPRETVDRSAERPAERDRLWRVLEAWMEATDGQSATTPAQEIGNQETKKALKALGYAE